MAEVIYLAIKRLEKLNDPIINSFLEAKRIENVPDEEFLAFMQLIFSEEDDLK